MHYQLLFSPTFLILPVCVFYIVFYVKRCYEIYPVLLVMRMVATSVQILLTYCVRWIAILSWLYYKNSPIIIGCQAV